MRIFILLIWQVFIVTAIFGQKTDSIKYSNGYLFFHEYGTGEPYILLSGGPGANYQQLEDIAINLAKRCRIILPEQRGTGRSMPQPFDTSTINLTNAHADLKQLLDHLKLNQAHFIGHSWGAMLAMSFACDYASNVKSLILLNPGPFKLDQRSLDIYMDNKEVRLTGSEKRQRDSVLKKDASY